MWIGGTGADARSTLKILGVLADGAATSKGEVVGDVVAARIAIGQVLAAACFTIEAVCRADTNRNASGPEGLSAC